MTLYKHYSSTETGGIWFVRLANPHISWRGSQSSLYISFECDLLYKIQSTFPVCGWYFFVSVHWTNSITYTAAWEAIIAYECRFMVHGAISIIVSWCHVDASNFHSPHRDLARINKFFVWIIWHSGRILNEIDQLFIAVLTAPQWLLTIIYLEIHAGLFLGCISNEMIKMSVCFSHRMFFGAFSISQIILSTLKTALGINDFDYSHGTYSM